MNEMTTISATNLVKFNLPDGILDAVSRQLGGSGNYASVEKSGGFKITGFEKVVPEIKGVITDLQVYQGKFEGGQMLKLDYDGGTVSSGYSLRGDLSVMVNPSYDLQLSLSPTSLKGAVSYLKSLQNQGVAPNQVLTTFRTKSVTGNYGSYSIATFEASPLPALAQSEMKNITPQAAYAAPSPAVESQLPAGWRN